MLDTEFYADMFALRTYLQCKEWDKEHGTDLRSFLSTGNIEEQTLRRTLERKTAVTQTTLTPRGFVKAVIFLAKATLRHRKLHGEAPDAWLIVEKRHRGLSDARRKP